MPEVLKAFNIIIPLKKGEGNSFDLVGIASTTSIDRDEERMSDKALKMMVDDINSLGVNLFGNHEHNWENILGGINQAELIDKKVHIGINLNRANPKYQQLVGTINTKGVNVGLSVGGNVISIKEEYDRARAKKVRILDEVKIYEISVVGIPSNSDAFVTLPMAIAKSAKFKTEKRCNICYSDKSDNLCGVCGAEE